MKNKKYILVSGAAAVALFLFTGYLLIGNPVVYYHNLQLKQAVTGLKEDTNTITLNEIVPFDWDIVYTFEPYTAKEEIAEIIGFDSSSIQETVSEGMVQLLFVKDRAVVSSVCGYAENLGYTVEFEKRVAFKDHILFVVDTGSDIVRLVQQK